VKAQLEQAPEIAAIITAIGGLATGIFGGIKFGRNQQIEEVKSLIVQYKDANEFTKKEILDVKVVLAETRDMHKECEEGRNQLAIRVGELELAMKK
jgi:hypothetical protein